MGKFFVHIAEARPARRTLVLHRVKALKMRIFPVCARTFCRHSVSLILIILYGKPAGPSIGEMHKDCAQNLCKLMIDNRRRWIYNKDNKERGDNSNDEMG